MTLILGTATVPSNATVAAFTLPAGLCNFTFYQPTNPQPVYLGTSPNVSSTNGVRTWPTPIQQESYNSVAAATYYATTGNGTASSFCYIISTAN